MKTKILTGTRNEEEYCGLQVKRVACMGNKLMVLSSQSYIIPGPDFILQLSIAQDETCMVEMSL